MRVLFVTALAILVSTADASAQGTKDPSNPAPTMVYPVPPLEQPAAPSAVPTAPYQYPPPPTPQLRRIHPGRVQVIRQR
jgi:hypothetical protein